MSLRKFIISNSWFRAAAIIALIQQVLVAGGTFLMGDIASQLPVRGLQVTECLLLFVCMTLSGSVVFYLLNIFSLRSQRAALSSFFSAYFENTFGRPSFWRNPEERAQRHDMMCREGQDAVQEGNAFLLDVWTTAWNIALNTLSVVLIIGAQAGLTILTSGLLSSLLVHWASKSLSKCARDEMDDQNKLNSHLSSGWDNLILGNTLSANIWKNKFTAFFTKANSSSERGLKQREKILAMGNFVTSGAVVGSVFIQAWLQQKNISMLIGLFAMLPRTMQIVMHLQVVQSYWAGWQRTRERLALASHCLSPFPQSSIQSFIKFDQINTFDQQSQKRISSQELLNKNHLQDTGRLTIRGANGAGKSVLLSLLKEKFSDKAFYLPAQHALEIPGVKSTMSHGEKLLAALSALTNGEQQVLLLDEWDANLSEENRDRLDAELNRVAHSVLVIEVRHTQSATFQDGIYACAHG